MSILSNPKLLYFTRIAQLLLGIIFLVLICYDGTHRSWWRNINGPLAVGVISSIFTFVITAYSIFTHHRSNPFSGGTILITLTRLAAELLVLLLWIASAALMLRPRGGCEFKHTATQGTPEQKKTVYCWDSKGEHGKRYDDQPIKTWDTGIVIGLVEAVSFIATLVMVWLNDRGSKVRGGTSYA